MFNAPGRLGRIGVTAKRRAAPVAGAILLIVAGQSNARKAGTSTVSPPARYTSPTNAYVWQVSGAAPVAYIADTNSGHEGDDSTWGSEAEVIYQMRANGETRDIYVVHQAVNGQALDPSSAGTWYPDISGSNFNALETQVANLRAWLAANASYASLTEYILWNQGENDASDATRAANYADNFTAFLTAFRSRISSGYFIAERIRPLGYGTPPDTTSTVGYDGAYKVREAQLAGILADGNGTAISTDFADNFSEIHPTEPATWDSTSWTTQCGLRCYAAIMGTYTATYGNIFDAVPDAMVFADSDGTAGSVITSNEVQVSGIERRALVDLPAGVEARVRNDNNSLHTDWTSTDTYVDKYQRLTLRATAPTAGTTDTHTVTVGGVACTWELSGTAASSYEAETDAFIAKLATEGGASFTTPQKDALDAFYVTAKASTWWAKLVTMRFRFNSEIANRIEMRDQATMAVQGAPANLMPWVSGEGYKPNANGQYINLQVNPSTQTTQNSVGLGFYLETTSTSANYDIYGSSTLGLRVLTASARGQTHSANISFTATYAAGFYHLNRSGASANQFYGPAGTSLGTSSAASSTPTATSFSIGSTGITADRAVGAVWLSASLDAAEVLSFRNALVTLRSAF